MNEQLFAYDKIWIDKWWWEALEENEMGIEHKSPRDISNMESRQMGLQSGPFKQGHCT